VDAKATAEKTYADSATELQEISRWLYAHPEIAYEEHASSARLASALAAHGFEVTHPAWDLPTAFEARSGSGRREVVLCCEYDALPEVGHACGHNIIAAAALGAGIALAPLADDFDLTVRVLGTPAEEAGGGKVDLINAGAFATADLAMMIHPSTEDVVDPRVLAIRDYRVEYHGKEAHAAGSPEEGRNALDAAIQAYTNVSMLRQAMLDTDRVHGTITYGGGAPNVIPAYTRMEWMVRAVKADRLSELSAQVEACFEAAAAATGCRLELSQPGHPFRDMVTDALLADLYATNSAVRGRPMERSEPGNYDGSTDMGNVSHAVPSLHAMLDLNSGSASNHQHAYAAHTITPDGERAIRDGAITMAWTIIDVAAGDRWDELGTRAW
jgi:amidohydrolase